jgi:hypothetical protein
MTVATTTEIDQQKHSSDLSEGRPESVPERIIGAILWLNKTREQTIPRRSAHSRRRLSE